MIRYRLYRRLMKLAHRHGWHHMTTCYPCGDTMLVCHWCGIRIVTHKANIDWEVEKDSASGQDEH